MAKQPPTNYDKLRRFWYAKLKKQGFEDIEDINAPDLGLKNANAFHKNDKYGQHTPEWRRSKEEYHQMAEYFLNHYRFKSNLERIIWEYHVNGMGKQDIAATLKKLKLIKTGEFGVWKTIYRLKKIMFKGSYEEI